MDDLIVFHSEPFELIVEHGPKIAIALKRGSMKKARALIRILDDSAPLRILIGEYTEKAHDFISPRSAPGQLLMMKWQAIPALVEALEDEKLSFRKRAWILALLFSITLERDLSPMQTIDGLFPRGLLPDHETRGSLAASVTWKGGYSQGWEGEGARSGGRENIADQKALASRWLQFRREYLEISDEK
jgi:hypothetical protein